jgi:hypothetical protein
MKEENTIKIPLDLYKLIEKKATQNDIKCEIFIEWILISWIMQYGID